MLYHYANSACKPLSIGYAASTTTTYITLSSIIYYDKMNMLLRWSFLESYIHLNSQVFSIDVKSVGLSIVQTFSDELDL